MNATLDTSPEQRTLLTELLERYLSGVEVWAYGSRAKGTARRVSDLDLAAFAKTEQSQDVSALREALDESNLPFLVDLHVWDDLPESFQQEIRERHVVVQQASR